jgi:hypothetical protein
MWTIEARLQKKDGTYGKWDSENCASPPYRLETKEEARYHVKRLKARYGELAKFRIVEIGST